MSMDQGTRICGHMGMRVSGVVAPGMSNTVKTWPSWSRTSVSNESRERIRSMLSVSTGATSMVQSCPIGPKILSRR